MPEYPEPDTLPLFCPYCGKRITVEVLGRGTAGPKLTAVLCPWCRESIRLGLPGVPILAWSGHGVKAEPLGLPVDPSGKPLSDHDIARIRRLYSRLEQTREDILGAFNEKHESQFTRDEIVSAVKAWQDDRERHPLTCGRDSTHRPLVAVDVEQRVILRCLDCDYTQADIPAAVLQAYRWSLD